MFNIQHFSVWDKITNNESWKGQRFGSKIKFIQKSLQEKFIYKKSRKALKGHRPKAAYFPQFGDLHL